jgi:histidinol dehydrogenase
MRIVKLKNLSKQDYMRIIRRATRADKDIDSGVREAIERVRTEGDQIILKKYQQRYGKKNYKSIMISKEEIKAAYKNVDKKFTCALNQMIKNITIVHKTQLTKRKDEVVSPEDGVYVWREWRAIEKVGLYIPGGKAVYPSSVLMTAIPAKVAGCREIIICSPPGINGTIWSATLVAADMVGLKKIYKVGGAEAVAAMAYGTETIPKVFKIFGAGNSYVTAAKMQVLSEVAIDMPAGPSEVFIIADETASPAFIAADLLADGEHGGDSACLLLTTSKRIAGQTIKEITKQLIQLETKNRVTESLSNYGLIGMVDSINEAIKFINEYAPEHLEIMVKNPDDLVGKIKNAGSVFLGDWTTKSSGDYATGANHILPTGGFAKMYPPLGVDSFGKWMQVQKCTKEGLSRIKETIEIIADVEQLPAHKNATSIRFI